MKDKILVVDDEPDTLNLVKMILEGEGYQVISASDGDEALQKVEVDEPSFILLDLVMPGKSGLEVCKILKTQPKTKLIPVVTFSVLGRDVDKKLSREAGAESHFIKPFTPEDLIAEVRRHLEKAKAEGFSKALNLDHVKLKGRKILLEFDPTVPYEKVVRDFVIEAKIHDESVIILAPKTSVIYQILRGEKDLEFAPLTAQTLMSPILEAHPEKPLAIVFDNLTDMILSVGFQQAYNFIKNTLQRLADPKMTTLFLVNSKAHTQNEAYSIRALFSEQLTYGKNGLTIIKITS